MLEVSVLFNNNQCQVNLNEQQMKELVSLLNTNATLIKGAKYSLVELEEGHLCTNGNLSLSCAPKALEKLFEQIALIIPNNTISLDIYDTDMKKGRTIKYTNKTTSCFEYEG